MAPRPELCRGTTACSRLQVPASDSGGNLLRPEAEVKAKDSHSITFIADNPTCNLFLTVFNYCEGPLRIEVHSAMDSLLSATLRERGPEWTDLVSRAQRSEHRLHLHVMQVPQGLRARHWGVPLRTGNSTFYRAIQVLATEPGDEVAEKIIIDDIDSLLAHDLDAPGIH
ncbi:hypothetical protein B0H13DRAFT_2518782 [Mycena leptocephala]|nr:hypothetical protein B0H13DRAFT_2518782 [Mycena leptocephala]